jgi:hypothetical protein
MMTRLKEDSPIHPLHDLCTALAIIALLSMSPAALAQAVNTKVYPGTFCRPEAQAVNFVEYDEAGRILILPDVGSPFAVICPVVRDETAGTAGISRAFVRYVKASAQFADFGAFTCTLYSRNHFGVELAHETNSDNGPPGTKIFSFGPLPVTDQSFPGYYHFVCNIPVVSNMNNESSGIISYRVDEIIPSQAQANEDEEQVP